MPVSLRGVAVLVLAAILAWPGAVRAQQCHTRGGTNLTLDFGTVTAAGGTTSGHVPFYCQSGQPTYFTVCVYLTGGWQGAIDPRRMTNYQGSELLYDLFGDAAHTVLIGDVGRTPASQIPVFTPANNQQVDADFGIFGLVYPEQSVPAVARFQDHGISGILRYRYSSTGYPVTSDCLSGGSGGGIANFGTQGMFATFDDSCVLSAGDLDFGQATSLAQPIQSSSSIRVSCPAQTNWSLGLGNGNYFAQGTRHMEGAGGFIEYGLFLDASHNQAWGNTGADDRWAGSTGLGGDPVNVTVHGLVPAQAGVPAGEYTDIVIATLYY